MTSLSRPCPLLVRLVEEGWNDPADPVSQLVVRRYLGELRDRAQRLDTLVLGCTHYPLLRETLQLVATELWGHPVTLVDSAEAMAVATEKLLAAQDQLELSMGAELLHPTSRLRCFVTDEARVADVAARFLGRALPQVELVDL